MNYIVRQRALPGISALLCTALLFFGCQETQIPVAPDVDEAAFAAAGKKGGGHSKGFSASFTYTGGIAGSFSGAYIEHDNNRKGLRVGANIGTKGMLDGDVTISFPLAQAQATACNASDFADGCGCWLLDHDRNLIPATDVDDATKTTLIAQLDRTVLNQDWGVASFTADHPGQPTTGGLRVGYTDAVFDGWVGINAPAPAPPPVVNRLDDPNLLEGGDVSDPDDVRTYAYTQGGVMVQRGGGFGDIVLVCENTGEESAIVTLTR